MLLIVMAGDEPDNDWFDRAGSDLTALIVRAGDGPDNDWFERAVSGRGMGLIMTGLTGRDLASQH